MARRLSRLSLLTRFGVLSVVMLAALAAVLGHVSKREIEARAITAAEETAVLVARAGVQPNLKLDDLHATMSADRIAELDRRLQVGVFADTGIQRIKIFNGSG